MDKRESSLWSLKSITIGVLGIASITYMLKYNVFRQFFDIYLKKKIIQRQSIEIINTTDECKNAVNILYKKTLKYKVLGFDCEWVTKNGYRHPIALLQLSSVDGFCALFRLCKIQHLPNDLKDLLEDFTILKVGVASTDDANYLYCDYGVKVNSILDLRHLSVLMSEKPESLASMAKKYLNVKMNKNWQIRCSNWEASALSDEQIMYAAMDALAGVKVFEKIMLKIINNSTSFWFWKKYMIQWKDIENIFSPYLNLKFKFKHTLQTSIKKDSSDKNISSYFNYNKNLKDLNSKSQNRNFSHLSKSKIPFENCYMESPDGELLCTCDRRKAEWYVKKDLADIVDQNPFMIRLKFIPAGKSVGDVGKFYQLPRKPCCVVCGKSFPDFDCIHKNVVPREYRKLFPSIMKDHSSHDVLLLCFSCHQISNMQDQYLRQKLANMCKAPLGNKSNLKEVENFDIKTVKSAANALLRMSSKHNIPEERKNELEQIIFDCYPEVDKITEELLLSVSELNYRCNNPYYLAHGDAVVNYFKNSAGGLLELEFMWREHFIQTMNPKFMPELWSTTHNKSRLEIRALEGRVRYEDLIIAGLNTNSKEETNKQNNVHEI